MAGRTRNSLPVRTPEYLPVEAVDSVQFLDRGGVVVHPEVAEARIIELVVVSQQTVHIN